MTAEPVRSIADSNSAGKVVLQFAAAADAPAASVPIRIQGESRSLDDEVAHFAVTGHPTGLADIWLTVIRQPSDE